MLENNKTLRPCDLLGLLLEVLGKEAELTGFWEWVGRGWCLALMMCQSRQDKRRKGAGCNSVPLKVR